MLGKHIMLICKPQTHFSPKILSKAKSLYGWIDLIVNGNNFLSICTRLYKKYILLESINHCTLGKYIIMLVDIVGQKIKDKIQMGNCIADGWTQTGVHYVEIYHCWHILKTGSIKNLTALILLERRSKTNSKGTLHCRWLEKRLFQG